MALTLIPLNFRSNSRKGVWLKNWNKYTICLWVVQFSYRWRFSSPFLTPILTSSFMSHRMTWPVCCSEPRITVQMAHRTCANCFIYGVLLVDTASYQKVYFLAYMPRSTNPIRYITQTEDMDRGWENCAWLLNLALAKQRKVRNRQGDGKKKGKGNEKES